MCANVQSLPIYGGKSVPFISFQTCVFNVLERREYMCTFCQKQPLYLSSKTVCNKWATFTFSSIHWLIRFLILWTVFVESCLARCHFQSKLWVTTNLEWIISYCRGTFAMILILRELLVRKINILQYLH